MIRYSLNSQSVHNEVDLIDANWRAKAKKRSDAFVAKGRYDEKKGIWSTVKPVFMRLQKNKCAFCERQFESPETGTIEFDLEHFRPKSSVNVWPDSTLHPHLAYAFETGAASNDGYYWLAYALGNYAASCKVCNTIFKSNYFPVASRRIDDPDGDPSTESALLCYPLGDSDEDPQRLVKFVATTAVPVASHGPRSRRGQVIIDFFGLNSRLQLHIERARMISVFGPALASIFAGRETAVEKALIGRLREPSLPHSNCLQSFEALWSSDPALAQRTLDVCRLYVVGDQATPPQIN